MKDKINKRNNLYKEFMELGNPIIRKIESEIPKLKGKLEFRLFELSSGFEAELIKTGWFLSEQILARLPIEMFLINTPYSDSVRFRYIDTNRDITIYEHENSIKKAIEVYEDNWNEIAKRGVRGKIAETFSDRFGESSLYQRA